MSIRALIFDFDGVIVDTEPLHYEGFMRVMKRFGYSMTYEHYKEKYLAFQDRDCFIGILNEIGVKYDEKLLSELIEEKGRWFLPLLSELPIRVRSNRSEGGAIFTFEGLVEFVNEAYKSFNLSIASGAQRNEIEVVLKRLGIYDRFRNIVAAGDYENGKPHPDPYLTAYKRLLEILPDLRVEECAGIEDSFFGVRAVKAAGMMCIAVTNSYPESVLKENGADVVVDRLDRSLIDMIKG
jgi:beta-phosphoglucomutase